MSMISSLVALLTFLCQVFRNDGERVSDVHDGRTNLFLRYPSQANEVRYLHTSSQVHEGPDEEVQYG
jgi:hypothetical protein